MLEGSRLSIDKLQLRPRVDLVLDPAESSRGRL